MSSSSGCPVTAAVVRRALLSRRSPLADQAELLSAVTNRTSATPVTPATIAASLGLVPRGQRAPLDTFRAC